MRTTLQKKALVEKAVSLYRLTLNRSSKWFDQDLADYKTFVSNLNEKELNEKIARLEQHTNPNSRFNKQVSREIEKMDASGMYDIRKMKHINSLD